MAFFIRTKTNRLKLPDIPNTRSAGCTDISGVSINWHGGPVAKVGDFVHIGGGVSAGTVGRLIHTGDFGEKSYPNNYYYWWGGDVETLDGKIAKEWLWTMTVLTPEAVQEVKDFYINAGRPGRIKVKW